MSSDTDGSDALDADPHVALRELLFDLRSAIEAERAAGFTHEPVGLRLPESPTSSELSPPVAPASLPDPTRAEPRAPVAPAASAPTPAADAPALAAAADLDAVREVLGDCRRCALCQSRTRLIFGAGGANAELMVIGEAPGYQEDVDGVPFAGPAGEMLDKMLRHVLGLEPAQVYVVNVVKCRPPNNGKPSPDQVARCLPFLRRQVELVAPRIVLTLGALAYHSLVGDDQPITLARGRWRELGGRPLMPTFHPAFLLSKPQHKRAAFEDLKAVRARLDALR